MRTRQARAERLIVDEQNCGTLSLSTLFAALRKITDDPPDEDSAEILARALGCLKVGALVHLVQEARRAVEQTARSGVHTVEARIHELSQSRGPAGSELEMTVEGAREVAQYRNAGLIRFAVVFQALVWAIAVPPDDPRPIVY
jgi:hypothetical protein